MGESSTTKSMPGSSAATDYGGQGTRVNSVLPGATRTQMFEARASGVPGLEERLVSRQPLPRLCEAEEVAASALWLLSDEAAVVTGVCLPVDGGISIVWAIRGSGRSAAGQRKE